MYQKLVERLQDYFGISRKEARGALVLIVMCFVLIWTPFFFRRWILPLIPQHTDPQALQKLDSLAVVLEKQNQTKFKKYETYAPKPGRIEEAKPARLFDFDPNKASVEELTELGIPLFLAKRIDKFRSKGGKFRKKEDLLHIYDFPSPLFKRLEKHIVLRAQPSDHLNNSVRQEAFPGKKPTYINDFKKTERSVLAAFDINAADTTQLIALKGIGSKLSLRILKFRDGLGGFHSTDQYSEIFGLDSLALSELLRYAKISSSVKKLAINTVTVAELSSHTYLRNKKIASVIVNYRDQHGAFHSLEDLKKTKVLDDLTIKKLEPYLQF